MNITINPEHEQQINQLLDSGLIQSPEDVVAAGISRIADDAKSREELIQSLRDDIQVGLNDIEGKRVLPGENVYEEMTNKYG